MRLILLNKILIITAIIMTTIDAQSQNFSKQYNEAENKINWPEAFDLTKSDFYVHNEIEIYATPEQVWSLLIHALEWNQWYDEILDIKFEDESQKTLYKNVRVFWRSMGQNLNNTVKEFEPYKALAWQFNESRIQGYHAWVIIPTPNGCRVITDESQTGFLAKMQKIFIPNKLIKQHDKWLYLLKLEAEKCNPNLRYNMNEKERTNLTEILNHSHDKLFAAIYGLSPEQLNFKPSSRTWSISECIEHITLTELSFPAIVKEELSTPPDPSKREKVKIKDNEIRDKMIRRNGRAKSPKRYKPANTFKDTEEAINEFSKQRMATIQYVQTTNDDLRNHFWRHRLTGVIDLYQTLLLMSAHLERHIAQIEDVKSNENFPKVKD